MNNNSVRLAFPPKKQCYLFVCAVLLYAFLLHLDPQVVYPVFTHVKPTATGVDFNGWDRLDITSIVVGLAMTAWLGYSLISNFFSTIRVNQVTRIAAGFVVGYTVIGGITRIVSLILPLGSLYFPILAIAAFISWSRRKTLSVKFTTANLSVPNLSMNVLVGLGWFILLLLLLTSQFFMVDFKWVGHGPTQYANYLSFFRYSPAPAYFPIIPQHVDELLFAAFLTDPVPLTFAPIIPMWITLALVKVSVAALIYCLFLRLNVTVGWAALGSAFLMFGTTSLDPTMYIGLFDSFNPIAYTVHSGRVNGVAITLLLLTDLLMERAPSTTNSMGKDEQGEIDRTGLSDITYALLGIGIVCSSISNYVMLMTMCMVAWAARIWRTTRSMETAWEVRLMESGLQWILLAAAVLSMIFAYHLDLLSPPTLITIVDNGRFLIIGLIALGVFALLLTMRIVKAGRNAAGNRLDKSDILLVRRLEKLILMGKLAILMMVVVNVLANNYITRLALDYLHHYELLTGMKIVNPFGSYGRNPLINPDNMRYCYGKVFCDNRESGAWCQYNQNGFYFLGAYFVIFLMATMSQIVLSPISTGARNDSHVDWWLVNLFAILIMPILFLYADFIADAYRSWVKLRFLEIPTYCILFTFFLAASRIQMPIWRYFLVMVVCLYIILPILFTHRLEQWHDNGIMLLQLLKAGHSMGPNLNLGPV